MPTPWIEPAAARWLPWPRRRDPSGSASRGRGRRRGRQPEPRVPYYLEGVRWGLRLGDVELNDQLVISCPQTHEPRARQARREALEHGIGRDEQDAWALRSQERYAKALANGWPAEEIIARARRRRTRGRDQCSTTTRCPGLTPTWRAGRTGHDLRERDGHRRQRPRSEQRRHRSGAGRSRRLGRLRPGRARHLARIRRRVRRARTDRLHPRHRQRGRARQPAASRWTRSTCSRSTRPSPPCRLVTTWSWPTAMPGTAPSIREPDQRQRWGGGDRPSDRGHRGPPGHDRPRELRRRGGGTAVVALCGGIGEGEAVVVEVDRVAGSGAA